MLCLSIRNVGWRGVVGFCNAFLFVVDPPDPRAGARSGNLTRILRDAGRML
jgi:hypothetical protein